mmetsp:Transcript_23997/g.48802  ORF Transcript_23997/g.48802 Transcript_23997/m.48802 type:complete len:202 (-) Transcript_23997:279-884(-)
MALACSLADAKSTSPHSLYPLVVSGAGLEFIPTSMTTAPGLIQSPWTISAEPMAATTMSARRTCSERFFVLEWQTVTVPFMNCNRCATGMPTMFERPITTQSLPLISISERLSRSMQPAGVQGSASGALPPRRHMLPMLSAENPSTSFSTRIASSTFASLMCCGSGSCTRMPCTAGSAFNSLTHWSNSPSVTLASKDLSTE